MRPTPEPIGIIGAMHCELSLLLASMEQHEQAEFYGLSFHTGLLCGRRVVLVKAGIGKVNAARCTQLLIDHYHPAAIINTGIAGGLAPGLQVGDVVVADSMILMLPPSATPKAICAPAKTTSILRSSTQTGASPTPLHRLRRPCSPRSGSTGG